MPTESWAEYVRRIAGDMTQAKVAKLAGVHQAAVGRWLRGDTDAPRAESVVALARALNAEPVEALVAAGFITAEEAPEIVHMRAPLSDYSDAELLEELRRRMR